MPEAGSSIESSALLTECHPGQFLLEPPLFGDVGRMDEAVGECQEPVLLLLPRLEARLDQFYDDAAGARSLSLRKGLNAANHTRRQADTQANGRL